MIYLDNAASAPVRPRALAAAMPFLADNFANPSSLHTLGRSARLALEEAREQCAEALGALPEEIFFTSGGTESDNLAIFSALGSQKRRIVTTQTEHPAVLSACKELGRRGFEVVRIAPDGDGIIRAEDAAAAIDANTALVSVMAANNETGTLQPFAEIGALCRERGVPFHTDAVQAVGNIPLDMRRLPVDMLSVSAHKIGGIKGAGLLYVRTGTPLSPIIFGGGQERGMRSGTENVAAAAALGAAITEVCSDIPERQRRLSRLRDILIERLEKIPDSRLNGSRTERLCSNVNFSFANVDGEALVMSLDLMGVCASAASACSAGKQRRSHVLTALGLHENMLDGALRLTLSDCNTEQEILAAAEIVAECVSRQRNNR
ncbi:MAG: cysteine desulfurase [Lachnospiraceae bacterium]|nr:cysteine desulfurase [Ruminococcus sp.]MCM1275536.1 cysteine desulfurase [Lachnospiraceae bacterium]